ncbi:unnamed protein product [Mytilus coruscus]|uniref:THAP-type domain-containing protein n=1 Tax=Mytilus coruscus TaxID=42192 RepID=A0A6J8A8S5_MYTCO|nr:unnamed protein product [Mytilus coruscus]
MIRPQCMMHFKLDECPVIAQLTKLKPISDATRVCSSHFLTTEIQKTLTGKRKLAQGAVPSLFAWSISATPKRPGPRRRLVENFDDNIAKAPKLSCTSTSPDAENQILGEKIVTPFVSNDHDYVVETLSTEEKLQAALKEVELLQNPGHYFIFKYILLEQIFN